MEIIRRQWSEHQDFSQDTMYAAWTLLIGKEKIKCTFPVDIMLKDRLLAGEFDMDIIGLVEKLYGIKRKD